jgi:hypothetical protein
MHPCLPHLRRLFPPVALACLAIPSFCQSPPAQKPSFTLPPILVDSAKPVDDISVKDIEKGPCDDSSKGVYHPIAVEDFVGGKVKAIRVLRYSRGMSKVDPKEIPRILSRVWSSSFFGAECGIVWSEMTFWSIEASLEFEDGKTGLLITDGLHVALINHNSKSSFFRITPPHM